MSRYELIQVRARTGRRPAEANNSGSVNVCFITNT